MLQFVGSRPASSDGLYVGHVEIYGKLDDGWFIVNVSRVKRLRQHRER